MASYGISVGKAARRSAFHRAVIHSSSRLRIFPTMYTLIPSLSSASFRAFFWYWKNQHAIMRSPTRYSLMCFGLNSALLELLGLRFRLNMSISSSCMKGITSGVFRYALFFGSLSGGDMFRLCAASGAHAACCCCELRGLWVASGSSSSSESFSSSVSSVSSSSSSSASSSSSSSSSSEEL